MAYFSNIDQQKHDYNVKIPFLVLFYLTMQYMTIIVFFFVDYRVWLLSSETPGFMGVLQGLAYLCPLDKTVTRACDELAYLQNHQLCLLGSFYFTTQKMTFENICVLCVRTGYSSRMPRNVQVSYLDPSGLLFIYKSQ